MNTPTEMDVDVSMLMDTTRDVEPSQDGVVRWVASQSPNPALQALMREAEREKRTRPSTAAHEPRSWTYPLPSTTLSSAVTSSWQPSADNSLDAPHLPRSGSSSSLPLPASGPSVSRRAKPLSAAQRKPLASSTSSTNQPVRDATRPRSSSHSTTLSIPPAPKPKYVPQEEEPEALAFIELLRDVSKQLDQNSEKKQRLVVRAKDKEQGRSLGRAGMDNRTGLGIGKSCARPLIKTSSASAIYPVESPVRPVERPSTTARSTFKPELRGRALAKTASLDDPVSGKSTPTSLPSTNLNCDSKLASIRASNTPTAHKGGTLGPSPDDGDSAMQDILDLSGTDTERERPISGAMSHKDITTYMQVDNDGMYSNTAADTSFVQTEPPSQVRVAAPKPTPRPPQSNTTSRPSAPTQRTCTGPPPLGMRRPPQFQTSHYGSSQSSKGLTVPRFKPPLLPNAGRTTNKSGWGSKLESTTPSRSAPPVKTAKTTSRGNQDPDSSFDVSFDMDADALEEAMKAYD